MHRARARLGLQRCLRSPACFSMGYKLVLLTLLALALPAAWNSTFGRAPHLRTIRWAPSSRRACCYRTPTVTALGRPECCLIMFVHHQPCVGPVVLEHQSYAAYSVAYEFSFMRPP